MVDEELDLTARLDQAIKSYEARWKSVDNELYDLCRRRPSHDDFADVYTKVAVIGRVYEAGVARGWRGEGDPGRLNGGSLAASARRRPSSIHCGIKAPSAPAIRHSSATACPLASYSGPLLLAEPNATPATSASRSPRSRATSFSSAAPEAFSASVRPPHRHAEGNARQASAEQPPLRDRPLRPPWSGHARQHSCIAAPVSNQLTEGVPKRYRARGNGPAGLLAAGVPYRCLTGAAVRSRSGYAAWHGRGAGRARGLFPPLV